MTHARLTPLAAALAGTLALVGCGAPSDDDQVRDTARAALQAFGAGDGKRVCALVTSDYRDTLANYEDCPLGVVERTRELDEIERRALRRAELEKVTVRGERATVVAVAPNLEGEPQALRLRKVYGTWLVEDAS